jgi:hypothetical protein
MHRKVERGTAGRVLREEEFLMKKKFSDLLALLFLSLANG